MVASSSNYINRSSGISACDRAPRQPVVHRAGGTQRAFLEKIHLMEVDEEVHWGRRKYKACLDLYKRRVDEYVVLPGEDMMTMFIRNIAQKLLCSAFQHWKHPCSVEVRFKRLTWRIDVVLGGHRTKVKGYPGGGLMVFPGDKKLLVDWQEDEVAVVLASAIVDILRHSDAQKYLQVRLALDEHRYIPQVVKTYLTKLREFMWERERVSLKDRIILLTMEGAGYDRRSICNWYDKVQLPPFYKFFQPSYKCRASNLHAWSSEASAPTISQDEAPPAFRPKWYPERRRVDDMTRSTGVMQEHLHNKIPSTVCRRGLEGASSKVPELIGRSSCVTESNKFTSLLCLTTSKWILWNST